MTDTSATEVHAGIPDFAPPTDLPELQPFWDAAARGELVFPRCPDCERWHWYPGPACPCGTTAAPEWCPVPGTGVIHTFSRVHRAFLPSGSAFPYVVALVDIDDAPGVRLVTNLVGPGADTPRIGQPVVLSPTALSTHTLPTFAIAQDPVTRESA